MNTQRDAKILVHVAMPLKAEVDAAAAAEGRSTSDFVRRMLIDFADRRLAARATAEEAA
jgi:hypothetical protein